MGWRDRDYAAWTTEERRRFLSTAGGSRSRAGRTPKVSQGVVVAVAVAAALFALGHFPAGNPVVPALHFNLPSAGGSTVVPGSAPALIGGTPRPTVRLTGPTVVAVHSFLTFHGPVPTGDEGTVRVLGSMNGGGWKTLAVADASSGNYLARIAVNELGSLRIRIVFRDGAEATETIRIR